MKALIGISFILILGLAGFVVSFVIQWGFVFPGLAVVALLLAAMSVGAAAMALLVYLPNSPHENKGENVIVKQK